jgi:hypothetical protein
VCPGVDPRKLRQDTVSRSKDRVLPVRTENSKK